MASWSPQSSRALRGALNPAEARQLQESDGNYYILLLVLSIIFCVPLVALCTSLWIYRKSLPGILPEFRKGKATNYEHYMFKLHTEDQLRQAASAQNLPGFPTSASSSRLPSKDSPKSPGDDADVSEGSLEMEEGRNLEIRNGTTRGFSKNSGCSAQSGQSMSALSQTLNSHHSGPSGDSQSLTSWNLSSKQRRKKKGRSLTKGGRSNSKGSVVGPLEEIDRSDDKDALPMGRMRSLSEPQLWTSHRAQTLGERLALRNVPANQWGKTGKRSIMVDVA